MPLYNPPTGGTGVTAEFNAGNSGTAKTINWEDGANQRVTLTGNCTFTLSNPTNGATYYLRLIQDGTGSRTATWPATVKWPHAIAPTLTLTAAKTDFLTLYYDGTNYTAIMGFNY